MKRLYIIIAAMIISISGIMAQPGPVQKMAKSVFTLTTFQQRRTNHRLDTGRVYRQ